MKRLIATLVGTSMLVVALGACGSDSKSDADKLKTQISDLVNNAKDGTKTSDGKSGDANSISSLVGKANDSTYKATYKDEDGKTFTVVNKPPLSALIQSDSAQYQTSDGKLVSCDGTTSSATCTSVPGTGNAQGLLTSVFGVWGQLVKTLGSLGNLLGGIKTTSETIAGRAAECASVDASKFDPSETGTAQFCVDKELGITLRVKTSDNGKTSTNIEATEVSTDVSESDVTPPSNPQELTVPSFTVPSFTVPSAP